jgi:hypothetical protein
MLSEELKALAEKATPGPWGAAPVVPMAKNYFYLVGNREGNNAEKEIGTIGPSLAPSTEANAALIVALVNNLPAILSALSAVPVMKEALCNINRKASPDPERTMSEASNDLYWCACEARQALAALEGK